MPGTESFHALIGDVYDQAAQVPVLVAQVNALQAQLAERDARIAELERKPAASAKA